MGLLEELLRIFLENAPARLAALRAAIAARDAVRMEAAAHSLKGTLRALGAAPAQALAAALEAVGRQRRLDGAGSLLESLEREMARLTAFFAASPIRSGKRAHEGADRRR